MYLLSIDISHPSGTILSAPGLTIQFVTVTELSPRTGSDFRFIPFLSNTDSRTGIIFSSAFTPSSGCDECAVCPFVVTTISTLPL